MVTVMLFGARLLTAVSSSPPSSHAAPVRASAGGAGRLLERADRRLPGGADLSPAAGGRDQGAEALQLQAERG